MNICHHHQHQILNFSQNIPSLTATELAQANTIFNKLISHCELLQSRKPYKKVTLVRLTYEKSRSKETFLEEFSMYLDSSTQGCRGSGTPSTCSFGSVLSMAGRLLVAHIADHRRAY